MLLLIYSSHYSQNNCTNQRYVTEVFSGYDLNSAIYFASDDPYGLLTNQDMYLDIYEPTGDTLSNRPVIIHQFGGGFAIGWRSEPNIPDFAEMYTKRGFVFISIDYRLGFNLLQTSSAERAVYRGILDLRAALRFVADSAQTYGIDTSNIFLTGTSAGSIAALGQTFMNEADRPVSTFGTFLEPANLGCFNCSGNTNFNNNEVAIHGIINNWGAVLDTSLINTSSDPQDNVPVISFHGTDDNAVKYLEGPPFSVPIFPSMQGSFLIHERLQNLGIKNEFHPLVGFGHEPQLLNPDLTDTIVHYASNFLYEIMQGEIDPIVGDSLVCVNELKVYAVQNTIGSTYCWTANGGNIISQNANTVIVEWNNIGNHSLEVQELTAIEVNKPRLLSIEVQAPFNSNISYNSNDGLFTFLSDSVANASYFWDFGDTFNDNGINTTHQYNDTGSYEVVLTVDNNFCKVNDTVQIISDICPNASFSYSTADSILVLNNNAQFYDSIYWIFGDGNTSSMSNAAHQYTQEGSYTVTQIAYNMFCTDTLQKLIEIVFCAQAAFEYTANGLEIELINNSQNNNANFWNFGDGTTNGTENPVHEYANPGSYTITLIIFDNLLCSDTLSKTIVVNEIIDSTVSIFNTTANNKFKIYPNPTKGIVYITGQENIQLLDFELYNLIGETITFPKDRNTGNKTIDVSKLEDGVYILKIVLEDKSYLHKILKH